MKRNLTLLVTGIGVMFMVAGCSLAGAEQVYWQRIVDRARFQNTNSVQTPADRMHTFQQVIDQDARALVEDIDYILLRDRPSRLSKWHNR